MRKKLLNYAWFTFYSFLIMLFCTKSSPIYVLNDWYDANVYFTMGKGLVKGLVPYKDLFDHKGPFLYFLYGIGYIIDHSGFLGIFILQIISMSIVLICAYKIAKLYKLSEKVATIISLLSPITILSGKFYILGTDFGGGSPDEFVLPLFSLILYFFIKLLKNQDNLKKLAPMYLFGIGLLSSLIFQLKFTHLSLVIGLLFPFFIYILIKNFIVFLKASFLCVLGFIAGLLPYIIYATITNSFRIFLHTYIRFNKIYGSTFGSTHDEENFLFSLAKALNNLNSIVNDNILTFILILFGLLYFLYVHKENGIINFSILLSFISFAVVASIVPLKYCFIILGVFSTFGFMALYDFFTKLIDCTPKNNLTNSSYKFINIFTLCFIIGFTIFNNKCIVIDSNKITHIHYQKSCQAQVADIIRSDSSNDHSLLEVLSLDSGFYTASDIIPKSKYFYIPNISFDKYPYVFTGQYDDVCKKLNKYVISKLEAKYNDDIDKQEINSQNYTDKISCAIAKNYEKISTVNGTYLQGGLNFHLYKRID